MFTLICKFCKQNFNNAFKRKQFCTVKCRRTNRKLLHGERDKATIKRWNQQNKEKRRLSCRKWRSKNLEYDRERQRKFQKENLSLYAHNQGNRRARIKNATPVWLTDLQKKEIKDFYINKPKGMEVDHIVPLKGKNVCGLHVPWNLQYLTKFENISKHNKI